MNCAGNPRFAANPKFTVKSEIRWKSVIRCITGDSLGIRDPLEIRHPLKHLTFSEIKNVCPVPSCTRVGCGMIIAVDADVSEAVCEWLDDRLTGCAIIGEVVDNGHKVTHIIPGVTFDRY